MFSLSFNRRIGLTLSLRLHHDKASGDMSYSVENKIMSVVQLRCGSSGVLILSWSRYGSAPLPVSGLPLNRLFPSDVCQSPPNHGIHPIFSLQYSKCCIRLRPVGLSTRTLILKNCLPHLTIHWNYAVYRCRSNVCLGYSLH